jgi:hypothetical protein
MGERPDDLDGSRARFAGIASQVRSQGFPLKREGSNKYPAADQSQLR